MVQSINNSNIPVDPNPVGDPQPNSTHVTENKVSIFENSVLKLKIHVLNDTQLLRTSRTVQSFGDCFTANMAEKGFFGKIAQFFTNVGLYRQDPEKLLRNVEKNIDALGELIRTQANSNEKITSTMINNISKCIQTFENAVENIAGDKSLPHSIRNDFRVLYKKDIFKAQQYGFLRTIGEGMKIAEELTDLKTEADFKALKELADKIDTCDSIQHEHPSVCRKSLFTLLSNQFSHVTNNFLKKANTFITSVNDKLGNKPPKEEYETLTKQLHDFTANIRPFYDALASSGNERDEPQCIKDFRVNCKKTFNGFSKAFYKIKDNFMDLKYRYLDEFPFLEERK